MSSPPLFESPGLRVVRLADQRIVPWKNGRGSTRELLIHPADAEVATGFDWRISIAQVIEDGAFSLFPGVDRTLVLLDGEGLELTGAAGTIRIAGRYAIAKFSGDEALDARLLCGAVRDLNVMVRRAAFACTVAVVSVAGGVLIAAADPLVAIVLDGQIEVAGCLLAPTEAVVTQKAARLKGSGTLLAVRLAPRD